MPSITCTNCGAVLKTPTEVAPGKKVKCPKCKEAFVVEAPEEEMEPDEPEVTADDKAADEEEKPKKKSKSDDDEDSEDEEEKPKKKGKSNDDDEDEEEKPKKKGKSDDDDEDVDDEEDKPKKKRKNEDEEEDDDPKGKKKGKVPPKKGGSKMAVILGVVGVVLLSCCCIGGIGGWFGYTSFFAKSPVYGAWIGKDNPFFGVEFRNGSSGGKAFVIVIEDILKAGPKTAPEPNAKFAIIDDKTLEITMNDSAKKIPFAGASNAKFTFVVEGTELTLTNVADSKVTKLKRFGDRFK